MIPKQKAGKTSSGKNDQNGLTAHEYTIAIPGMGGRLILIVPKGMRDEFHA